MNKPNNLYHASENPEIEEFEPRAEKYRDPLEGPVVFATGDKAYASCFIVRTDHSWSQISNWGKDKPWVFICSDEEKFKQLDKGGAIYQLTSDTFYSEPTKGAGLYEWVSKTSVKPTNKQLYPSGLEAMIENGVQVFFVSEEELKKIRESSDHGLSILLDMQNQERSINQQRRYNVRSINGRPM